MVWGIRFIFVYLDPQGKAYNKLGLQRARFRVVRR